MSSGTHERMLIGADPAAGTTLADIARHQRGPLRPEQLVSVRKRQARRLAGHRFRAVDTVVLAVLPVLLLARLLNRPVLESSLADVTPLIVGAWATWSLLRAMGLYRFGRHQPLLGHLARVCAATLLAVGLAVLLSTVLPSEHAGTTEVAEAMAICAATLLLLHAVWWGIVARWRANGWLTPNIFVVGATAHAEDLIESALEHRDMHILGIFDDRAERSPHAVRGVPVLGTTTTLLNHRILPFVDLIVVALDPTATTRARETLNRLSVLPNEVTMILDRPGSTRLAAAIGHLSDAPLAPLRAAVDPARRAHAKRIQDLAIGLPVLVCAAPVLALIALAIRIDSPGPVFFRQRRHGFNNEEIVVWKFRTMRHEAADATASRQVTAGDDRVTRMGRILRKTGLDEVPQLFNVVTGEMSLVGPRPHAIGMRTGEVESAQLVAEYAQRHRIKPGMTGWAAVNGSRGPLHTPEEVIERVSLDIDYIERQSVWLDLLIMARTVPSMLGDRSAVR